MKLQVAIYLSKYLISFTIIAAIVQTIKILNENYEKSKKDNSLELKSLQGQAILARWLVAILEISKLINVTGCKNSEHPHLPKKQHSDCSMFVLTMCSSHRYYNCLVSCEEQSSPNGAIM